MIYFRENAKEVRLKAKDLLQKKVLLDQGSLIDVDFTEGKVYVDVEIEGQRGLLILTFSSLFRLEKRGFELLNDSGFGGLSFEITHPLLTRSEINEVLGWYRALLEGKRKRRPNIGSKTLYKVLDSIFNITTDASVGWYKKNAM